MFLPVSRALAGHGVFSALFLTSVRDLGRPTGRLGAGGAGLSRWGGGVRCIVFPVFPVVSSWVFRGLVGSAGV